MRGKRDSIHGSQNTYSSTYNNIFSDKSNAKFIIGVVSLIYGLAGLREHDTEGANEQSKLGTIELGIYENLETKTSQEIFHSLSPGH